MLIYNDILNNDLLLRDFQIILDLPVNESTISIFRSIVRLLIKYNIIESDVFLNQLRNKLIRDKIDNYIKTENDFLYYFIHNNISINKSLCRIRINSICDLLELVYNQSKDYEIYKSAIILSSLFYKNDHKYYLIRILIAKFEIKSDIYGEYALCDLRCESMKLLANIRDSIAIEYILPYLNSHNPQECICAIESLTKFKYDSQKYVDRLEKIIADDGVELKIAALKSLIKTNKISFSHHYLMKKLIRDHEILLDILKEVRDVL